MTIQEALQYIQEYMGETREYPNLTIESTGIDFYLSINDQVLAPDVESSSIESGLYKLGQKCKDALAED